MKVPANRVFQEEIRKRERFTKAEKVVIEESGLFNGVYINEIWCLFKRRLSRAKK